MTKNLEIDPDTLKLAELRADALAAIAAHEAIDAWFSPEGRAACRAMILACAAANAEMERLAADPKTHYGDWRSLLFDVELMTLGYI